MEQVHTAAKRSSNQLTFSWRDKQMRAIQLHWQRLLLAVALCLILAGFGTAADPTKDEIKQFLLNAKVVNSKHTGKGITDPWRLTLSDGTITHDGGFQAIDEHKPRMQFSNGSVELNFVDSYKYNVAAYILAEMVGMDDMVPVYVERKWKGQAGSLSWWLPVKMDEADRLKQKISAPDTDAWNKQMYRIRVFDELVYDSDPNLTNVLISEDWKIFRVDFSRAFRLFKDVKDTKNLVRCDRQLLEKMKALNESELKQKTKGFLTDPEVQSVIARRDKIVAYFQKLAAEKGEKEVIY
jgi:hypothetical protein